MYFFFWNDKNILQNIKSGAIMYDVIADKCIFISVISYLLIWMSAPLAQLDRALDYGSKG